LAAEQSSPSNTNTPQPNKNKSPTFLAKGFQFCTQLENSEYDATAYVYAFQGSFDEGKFNTKQFVEVVDKTAKELLDDHLNDSRNFDYEVSILSREVESTKLPHVKGLQGRRHIIGSIG
jgi:hypothetical protein